MITTTVESTTETGDIRTACSGYVCAKCDSPIPVGATFAWFPERRQRVCGECSGKEMSGRGDTVRTEGRGND